VQGRWDGEEKRASLWGMDRAATAQAVRAFVEEGHCDALLRSAWKLADGVPLPSAKLPPQRG
jgi:hypothetical protein